LHCCVAVDVAQDAVDQDVSDTLRRHGRLRERRRVGDGMGIEHRHVGMEPHAQFAALRKVESARAQRRHLVNGSLQREEAEVAAVATEDPRKRAP